MNFTIGTKGDIRIVPVTKDQVPQGLEDLATFLKEKKLFTGAKGEVYADLGLKGHNVVLVGLGEQGKLDEEVYRLSFYKVGKELAKAKVTEVTVDLPQHPELCYRHAAMAAAEGLYQSVYSFDKYLTTKEDKAVLNEVGFKILKGKEDKVAPGLEEISNIISGLTLARNLVNEPAETIYPATLAKAAEEALTPLGVEVEVMGLEQIKELGMTAFLAVARGSSKEPKLIVMRYKGGKADDEIIGLVGKGLTYDSGGYAIKPAGGMVTMHTDMGGAGGVIGAMAAIAGNKIERNVTAVVASCENMISGDAYKNGDIIKAMSGKTIEIGNTDAEGRVTLADAIYYTATKENVSEIIDVATLTGAVIVALGSHYTGAVTNDQAMMDKVLAASKTGGEKLWQLPSDDIYRDMVKGKRADLLNSVKGGAGSITAGLFLENFTEGKKWVHMDIAGTSHMDSPSGYLTAGATGVPVKTLYHYCKGEENLECC